MKGFIRSFRCAAALLGALVLAGCPGAGDSGGDGTYRVRAGTFRHGELVPYPEEGPEGTEIEVAVYADEGCRYIPGTLYYRPLPEGDPLFLPVDGEQALFHLPPCDVELGAEFLSLEELGRRMIPVSPHTVARNAGPAGGPFANAAASPVTVPGFTIAATEVPYQLWYTVRTWAEHEDRGSGRYSFPKDAGKEGSADGSGNWIALPTSRHNYNPVVAVSWQDALVWCNAYSDWAREVRGENTWPVYRHNGVVLRNPAVATAASPDVPALNAPAYRLPTEAEWEYAARGGDPGAEAWDYPYAGGVEEDRVAWHRGNAEGSTHQVGLKDPNTLGLYDMSGNAEEWCWDFHSGTSRVLRGGRFDKDRIDISLNARRGQSQSSSANRPGFRVVRPLD